MSKGKKKCLTSAADAVIDILCLMHKAFGPQICYMPCTHLCPVTFWGRTAFVMIVIQLSTTLCRQFQRGHCVVNVVSNKVEVNPMHTAQRWFRAESKQVQIPQLFLIQHFNQTMGGVDHTDQNLDKYRIAICCCWSLLYSAILRSVECDSIWVTRF